MTTSTMLLSLKLLRIFRQTFPDFGKLWQTWRGQFSAVSTPNFASKYSLESSRRISANGFSHSLLADVSKLSNADVSKLSSPDVSKLSMSHFVLQNGTFNETKNAEMPTEMPTASHVSKCQPLVSAICFDHVPVYY